MAEIDVHLSSNRRLLDPVATLGPSPVGGGGGGGHGLLLFTFLFSSISAMLEKLSRKKGVGGEG